MKMGLRKNVSGWVQKYLCTSCHKYFVDRKGFENFRHKAEVITAALDLRAKGMSLADVVDHVDQHHRVKVSRTTILDWQNKFGKKLKSFTQTLQPVIGGIIHADEMFVKVREEWHYYWDAMDYSTKFLVGDHLSDERNEEECMIFLQNIKQCPVNQPREIHTDCSYDYPVPITKVFGEKGILHCFYPAWKKKFKNNPIERLHNTKKQTIKTFRNFDNSQSTAAFFEFDKIYYNFIRKHTSLNHITPAEAAGIFLQLQRNRFLSLIEKYQPIIRAS
jgi:transposase-like protein|tara:strand:+ start:213 stop:1037 length:825 start_codon:yes stop_codon:yes gene_type:complete